MFYHETQGDTAATCGLHALRHFLGTNYPDLEDLIVVSSEKPLIDPAERIAFSKIFDLHLGGENPYIKFLDDLALLKDPANFVAKFDEITAISGGLSQPRLDAKQKKVVAEYYMCLTTLLEHGPLRPEHSEVVRAISEKLDLSTGYRKDGLLPNTISNFLENFLEIRIEFETHGVADYAVRSLSDLVILLESRSVDRAIIGESIPMNHFYCIRKCQNQWYCIDSISRAIVALNQRQNPEGFNVIYIPSISADDLSIAISRKLPEDRLRR